MQVSTMPGTILGCCVGRVRVMKGTLASNPVATLIYFAGKAAGNPYWGMPGLYR
jgi:hypothetical protein